ncbi:GGDEF domain-containing protein [Undibacterium sp. Ji49W]|uniref:GGDEF domain-containing protein n=1 Tax=Undibacterium sp. Ji49W TaxID=3413040 RepID=UPI003BEFD790
MHAMQKTTYQHDQQHVENKDFSYTGQQVKLFCIGQNKTTADLLEEIARLKRSISDLEIENRTDLLTGLLNRRGFIAELNMAWDKQVRYAVPTTLMILDMNRFKQINDSYGHEAGDKALKLIAVYLQNNLRSIDILGRLGGDEFAVILPHTNSQEAQQIADKLLDAIPVLQISGQHDDTAIALEFALGFSELNSEFSSPKAWLQAADLQMYHSKVTTTA